MVVATKSRNLISGKGKNETFHLAGEKISTFIERNQ